MGSNPTKKTLRTIHERGRFHGRDSGEIGELDGVSVSDPISPESQITPSDLVK